MTGLECTDETLLLLMKQGSKESGRIGFLATRVLRRWMSFGLIEGVIPMLWIEHLSGGGKYGIDVVGDGIVADVSKTTGSASTEPL